MPVGARRNRTLYGLASKMAGVHRYTKIRWGVGITLTILVALLPLTNTLRIDLWSNRSAWLGEEVGLVEALKAFAFPFLAINVGIILASRFLGRWLCGFVCPIGNLNRLQEWFDWRLRRGRWKHLASVVVFLACLLLAAITFSFWVDWRVFTQGSGTAVTVASLFLAATTLVIFGVVRGLGMRFCRDYCPSGVYFAVLGPESHTGVEFRFPENCTDCHACENACPVDLEPRKMAEAATRPGTGFYPDGLSNYANCLRCGDCVAVCEVTAEGEECEDTPLQLGWIRGESDTGVEEKASP